MPPTFRHLPCYSLDDVTGNFEQLISEWNALVLSAVQSQAQVGPWQEVESVHANVENYAALQTLRVRREGQRAFLRGGVHLTAELVGGTHVFTIPIPCRPPGLVIVAPWGTASNLLLEVKANGEVVNQNQPLLNGGSYSLDGLTWNLT